ncbi:MAG: membrane protein insertion efficiency factor YidD [Cytophagaceae bacterium]|nr:membrane protein insertion efficiency factor YidD [Cytophagaceae bacterium]
MRNILAYLKILLSLPKYLFMGLIWLYKHLLSPLLPNACRFSPTCSQYGMEAFKKHGVFKGGYMTFKRIIRCHPWGGSGYDPVK